MYHDEFGCTSLQTNRTARLQYYTAERTAAEENGVGWAIWDDDGWWKSGSVVLSLRTTAHPLHTISSNIFGASGF